MTLACEDFFEKIAFEKLKKFLKESVGLNCDSYRPEYLKRRLDLRLRATKTKSYSEYYRYLKANPNENELLLNEITVNYTMFFRDSDVFEHLRNIILPQIFSSSKNVRIWSAGCATGEEPYAMAILLHEVLKHRVEDLQIIIYASDIDNDALAKAKKGEYGESTVQGVEKAMLNRYFSYENELYRVKDFVKKFIRFEQQDINKPPAHRNLDLIMCRNVMIYFSRESQQKIHMHFYEALKNGGYLVTGKAEMLTGEPNRKFVCTDARCRVYRKPELNL